MLLNVPCTSGDLQVDDTEVKVITAFKRVVWSTPRRDVTYIGVKKNALKADLTIYTASQHFPAHFLTRQNADKFLALFPGVPMGLPLPAAPPVAQSVPRYAAPTTSYQAQPPTKKKTPRWAYIATGVIALVLCACISTAVIAAVTSNNNNNSSAQVVATPTDTPTDTSQSSTLAATAVADTPTIAPTSAPAPTQAPTAKPTPKPTPRPVPTRPPAPTPTPCSNPCNPWGYNFSPGFYITSPPSAFCTYFTCI